MGKTPLFLAPLILGAFFIGCQSDKTTESLGQLDGETTVQEERVEPLEATPSTVVAPPLAPPPAAPGKVPGEPPDWLEKSAWEDEATQTLYAVGRASGIKNPALARSTAANRARGELARHLGAGVQPVTGIQILEHWQHPNGTVYALVGRVSTPSK